MTTRVVVANMGPDMVAVEKQGRDTEGKFTDGGPKEFVSPQGAREFYVTQTDALIVTEIKQ